MDTVIIIAWNYDVLDLAYGNVKVLIQIGYISWNLPSPARRPTSNGEMPLTVNEEVLKQNLKVMLKAMSFSLFFVLLLYRLTRIKD